MMNESMDSRMGGVMGLAWLPMLLGLVLLIGGIVLLFRLFSPTEPQLEGGTTKVVLAVLAVIGGIVLVGAVAMMPMHVGMMGMMR